MSNNYKSSVLVINSDTMGSGDNELGKKLIYNYFSTIVEAQSLPGTILFYNTGVKLVAKGSPVVDFLELLSEKGIEILVCGTCLKYFKLENKIAVGRMSDMKTISEKMFYAENTITL